jgi:hypothetical protein
LFRSATVYLLNLADTDYGASYVTVVAVALDV